MPDTTTARPVGRPRLYEDRADKQREYRKRKTSKAFAELRDLAALRRQLASWGDTENVALLERVERILVNM